MGLRRSRRLAFVPIVLAGLLALAPAGGSVVSSAARPAAAGSAGGSAASSASGGSATTGSVTTTSASTTTTPTVPPTVVPGGNAVIAVSALPTQFNPNTPAGESAATAMVDAAVLPSPFVIGPDGNEEASQDFDSAELVSLDPETIVYTINPAAVWSDGTPITVADFVEEWHEQLLLGPQLPASDPYSGYEDIASIKGSSDGKVVTVTFAKPYSQWEALFSGLVPAGVARRYGFVAGFAASDPVHLLSGGPYEVTKVMPGKELVLSRNPRWWGPRPVLDHLVFEVLHQQSTILAGLVRGTINVAELTPTRALGNAVYGAGDLVMEVTPGPREWQLVFNLNDPVVSSLLVREAVAKATDRVELEADTVGFAAPANPLVENRMFPSVSPRAAPDDVGFGIPNQLAAEQLLADAGYRIDADGVARNAAGVPLVLHLTGPTGDGTVDEMETELQAQLLDVGIRLDVENVPFAQLLGHLLPAGAYQLAFAPYLISSYPAENARYYEDPVAPVRSVPIEGAPGSATSATSSTTSTTSSPAAIPAATGASGSGATASSTTTTSSVTTTTLVVPPAVTSFPALAPGRGTEPDAMAAESVTADVLGYEDPAVSALLTEAEGQLNVVSMDALYNEADADLWLDLPTLPLFEVPVALVTSESLVDVVQTPTLAGPLFDVGSWAFVTTARGATRATDASPMRSVAGRAPLSGRGGAR